MHCGQLEPRPKYANIYSNLSARKCSVHLGYRCEREVMVRGREEPIGVGACGKREIHGGLKGGGCIKEGFG